MVTRFKLGAAVVCAGLFACAGEPAADETESDDVSLEVATQMSALEVDEDGSDEDFADATDDAPVIDRDCSLRGRRQRLIAHYDTDGDGALSEAERDALREDFGGGRRGRPHVVRKLRREFLSRLYDADRSGDLDEGERAELNADLEARCEAQKAHRLANYDADASGDLSESEWQALAADVKARFAARHAKWLEAFDANQNGKLDPAERAAARAALHDRLKDRRAALEAEFDTDGNGKLDADERLALVEELKARVRGEHFGEGDQP